MLTACLMLLLTSDVVIVQYDGDDKKELAEALNITGHFTIHRSSDRNMLRLGTWGTEVASDSDGIKWECKTTDGRDLVADDGRIVARYEARPEPGIRFADGYKHKRSNRYEQFLLEGSGRYYWTRNPGTTVYKVDDPGKPIISIPSRSHEFFMSDEQLYLCSCIYDGSRRRAGVVKVEVFSEDGTSIRSFEITSPRTRWHTRFWGGQLYVRDVHGTSILLAEDYDWPGTFHMRCYVFDMESMSFTQTLKYSQWSFFLHKDILREFLSRADVE